MEKKIYFIKDFNHQCYFRELLTHLLVLSKYPQSH